MTGVQTCALPISDDKDSTKKELLQEQAKLVDEIADLKVPLTEVQEDLKKLRDIRYWVRKATPGTEESKEPPKKQPMAMEDCGFSKKDIRRVVGQLYEVFDLNSVEDAKEKYLSSPY